MFQSGYRKWTQLACNLDVNNIMLIIQDRKLPSVVWHHWLGIRKGTWLVKITTNNLHRFLQWLYLLMMGWLHHYVYWKTDLEVMKIINTLFKIFLTKKHNKYLITFLTQFTIQNKRKKIQVCQCKSDTMCSPGYIFGSPGRTPGQSSHSVQDRPLSLCAKLQPIPFSSFEGDASRTHIETDKQQT